MLPLACSSSLYSVAFTMSTIWRRWAFDSIFAHHSHFAAAAASARGDMENRIKECQLGLYADRTSCHLWWPNQFRLLLASLAYILMERLRHVGLAGTELARAQIGTLRCKLLKVGAVVVRNTRRIRFFISSAFPDRDAFQRVAQRFAASG
jgi:Transposase DDE domain group 1